MHCRSFITFLQILVGVLVPMLFMAHTEWPTSHLPTQDAAATSAAVAGARARLRRGVWRAAMAANWVVWRCARLPKHLSAPAYLWAVLSLTWSLSIALHGM